VITRISTAHIQKSSHGAFFCASNEDINTDYLKYLSQVLNNYATDGKCHKWCEWWYTDVYYT